MNGMVHPVTGREVELEPSVPYPFLTCACGNTYVRWTKEAACGKCRKAVKYKAIANRFKSQPRKKRRPQRNKKFRFENIPTNPQPIPVPKPPPNPPRKRRRTRPSINCCQCPDMPDRDGGKCLQCGLEVHTLRVSTGGPENRQRIFDKSGGRCWYCGLQLEMFSESLATRMTVDHLVALVRGGSRGIQNLVPSCGPCNSDKSNFMVDEYRAHKREFDLSFDKFWFETQQQYEEKPAQEPPQIAQEKPAWERFP